MALIWWRTDRAGARQWQGGRSQHLTLAAALQLQDTSGITLLAGGTDGTDGPTDAAGAIVDGATAHIATERGLDGAEYLTRCDTHHFFTTVGGLVRTGPTLTNVMDLIVVLVR